MIKAVETVGVKKQYFNNPTINCGVIKTKSKKRTVLAVFTH